MGLEMFILCLLILMGATAVIYSVELYAFVFLVLGSIIRVIKNFINTTLGRK